MLRKTLIVALICVPVILAAVWLALRRADTDYDALAVSYALEDSRFLTLEDGLKIHFTDSGAEDGSVIVLIHGFSSSLHTWIPWKTGLEDGYRVITLDLPGHGLSHAYKADKTSVEHYVDILHAFTRALELERFTLAGHSMGGNIAWKYSLKYPHALEGLILVAASGWPSDQQADSDDALFVRAMRHPFTRTILKTLDMGDRIRSGLGESYADQQLVTENLVQRYIDFAHAPGHREALMVLASKERVPAKAGNLAMISVPVLILWGRVDALVPVADANKFAAAISGARHVIYDDVGHFPHEEAVARSLAEVQTFMQGVEWQALPEEIIMPQGDPRLVQDR